MTRLFRFLSILSVLCLATMSAHAGDVLDRVVKSKTLRCGYTTWPPLSQKNPKTGKMEGLYIDLTEELAAGLDWKVDWVEEITLADFVTALDTNRVDMLCTPMIPAMQRLKYAYFTYPHFYAPYNAYVRTGDKRFTDDITALNDPGVTISTMEGEYTSILAHHNFPKAKVLEISQAQGNTQLYENVVAKKADVIFMDPFTFSTFNATHKDVLRNVGEVSFFSVGFALKFGENEMARVIDAATQELHNRRYIETLANKYHILEAGIYLPADGFKK